MTEQKARTLTVLGIGNTIMGDDGVGLAIFERLRELRPDERLTYIAGGTSGMELIPDVQDASRLLILDGIAPSDARVPGEVLRIDGDQVPRLLASKLSPHQVGMLDVLAAARLLGTEPDEVVVVGVVPVDVDLRLGLSPEVADGVEPAAQLAASVVDEWLS